MKMVERLESLSDKYVEIKKLRDTALIMEKELEAECESICRDLGGEGLYSVDRWSVTVTEDGQGKLRLYPHIPKVYKEPVSKGIKV